MGPVSDIVPLKDGQEAIFIATATSPGNRSIRIVDQFWIADAPDIREPPFPASGPKELLPRKPEAADARIVNIVVRERPMFMIFDRALMKDVQTIAAIIGVPGLLIFLLSAFRDRRAAAQKQRREESSKRVTGPPASYQKPRRTDR